MEDNLKLDVQSTLLRLSPTIAGVTLLSLGNGAPDVFSSLVSFQESGTRDMGFNTVLGGVSFVSCVVVGSVSIAIRQSGVQVAKSAFVRDVYFLLFVVLALFVIVYASFTRWKEGGDDDERGGIGISDCDNDLSLSVPLLNGAQEYDLNIEKDYCCMRYSMWVCDERDMELHHSSRVGRFASFNWLHMWNKSFNLELTVPGLGELTWGFGDKLNDGFKWWTRGCSKNPQPVVIPRDPYLWETMVFLVAGLVWALVVLRKTDMKLDGLLGGGLLFVYFLSLFIRLIQTKGSLQ
ncbi:hypothetical protein JHK85_011235 [Glycine max]|nr:hypothetical protein JHK85_011235 [Glycine max]KAG5067190.1 hypothetical protein JHK86_010921 [Glycine max]